MAAQSSTVHKVCNQLYIKYPVPKECECAALLQCAFVCMQLELMGVASVPVSRVFAVGRVVDLYVCALRQRLCGRVRIFPFTYMQNRIDASVCM